MRAARLQTLFMALLPLISVPRILQAQQRLVTETDLLKFVWIADPQISPDASRIAYVQVTANARSDGYDTSLWVVAAAAGSVPKQVTTGPRDAAPRWSPDGKRLAFVRSQQLYVVSADGGEARQLTELPGGAGAPEWSPDGAALAFTSTATADRMPTGASAVPASDVRVITRAGFRLNGVGYLDPSRPAHIWTVDVDGGLKPVPRQITTGEFEEGAITWARDGSSIYFTSDRNAEPYYSPPDRNLYSVPRNGGTISLVASIDGPIGAYRLSHDGTRVAFIGNANSTLVRSFNQPDLFVTSTVSDAAPRNLTTAFDFDIGGTITGDQRSPRGGMARAPTWTNDGRALVVIAAEQGKANLKRIDIETGRIENLTTGDQEVIAHTSAMGKHAVLISSATNIGDIWVTSDAAGALTRVTNVNQALFSGIRLTAPEEFWYTGSDGKKLHGWVQKPPDFSASRKYPLILDIHGGPHSTWGLTFMHEFHWMAAKGYVVVYVNPRGSSTYGSAFANVIQGQDPTDEYNDLMAGVDAVIARGYIDTTRQLVTGGSYGGFLTNWVVTRTNRFKAAVSQRSIADATARWYATPTPDFQPGTPPPPWEDPARYAKRSPITYVAQVSTPTLFVEGESDFQVPPWTGGEVMFRALKYLKRETAMVRFPDENHDLSRSGQPRHRVERLQHIVGWLERFSRTGPQP